MLAKDLWTALLKVMVYVRQSFEVQQRTRPAVLDRILVPARVMLAEDLMTPGTGRGTPGSLPACTLALCSISRCDTALAPISTPPAT